MRRKFYELDADNRICVTADTAAQGAENPQSYDFPADFDFSKQYDYKIIDGELVHDPIPEAEPEPSQFDIIEAQVTYTAMMTDTLLEV